MTFSLLFGLGVALLSTIFALQNHTPVAVVFLKWKFSGSLAMVLLLAFVSGALTAFLFLLPSLIRHRWTISRMKKSLKERQNEDAPADEQTEDANVIL